VFPAPGIWPDCPVRFARFLYSNRPRGPGEINLSTVQLFIMLNTRGLLSPGELRARPRDRGVAVSSSHSAGSGERWRHGQTLCPSIQRSPAAPWAL